LSATRRSFFVSGFVVMIGVGRRFRAVRSRDGVSAIEPDEPAHVVGEVGQADLHFRPPQTDRANDEAHRPFLVSEHMLDRGADFRLERIGAAGALGHRLALGLVAVNPRDEAARFQHRLGLGRAIGRLGPHVAGGVGRIEHVGKPRPVMGGRVGRRPFADQSVLAVDRDVVLGAEGWNGQIDRRN
jgi:hypothetical protein